ncbi:MAG: flagellar hook-associated protein FlgL [Armatimonadetes bacterium]|nr:flagellar hook-associated protein FlgL [Armatimonadota bacterium]
MRITNQLQYASTERALKSALERLASAQGKVVTGRRFEAPSDDPTSAGHALSLREQISRHDQWARNLREAKLFLSSSEVALGEINEIVRKVREDAVRGANDTLGSAERDAIGQQVGQAMASIVQLANQRVDDERYLFSGHMTSTKPFEVNGDQLVYNGDDNSLTAKVGDDRHLPMSLPGSFLTGLYAALVQVKQDLETSNLTRLGQEDIQALQNQMEAISRLRGDLGARLQETDRFRLQYEAQTEHLSELLASKEEIDLPTAIYEMKRAETSYQAALQVAANAHSMSLFDFLRGG